MKMLRFLKYYAIIRYVYERIGLLFKETKK